MYEHERICSSFSPCFCNHLGAQWLTGRQRPSHCVAFSLPNRRKSTQQRRQLRDSVIVWFGVHGGVLCGVGGGPPVPAARQGRYQAQRGRGKRLQRSSENVCIYLT